MRRAFVTTSVVWLIVCAVLPAEAQVVVGRATESIRVDGVLSESVWSQATPVPIDLESFPGDNIPAPVRTEVLVTWNRDTLFVAFRAWDPDPSQIRARYHERDAAEDDDTVGFYLDPFHDGRRGYYFAVNPLGVQIDSIISDVENSEDGSWDAIWESAGQLTPEGFTVEVAIPLQQLRMPTVAGPQTWGFMATRHWPRDVAHTLRSIRTDQNRNCLVCQLASIQGVEVATVGKNAELTPTVTWRRSEEREEGRLRSLGSEFDAGLSGRWGITPATSLQFALNPDFSQVEADAAQLDVNTRFALSYPEKRPFFLEGADYFETQLNLVFTRTIADPSGGLKLTGKSGDGSYGLLVARDEVTNLLIPGDESSSRTAIAGESTTAAARYSHDIGANGNVGGVVTSRSGSDYRNTVLSLDSYYRIGDSDAVRMQFASSSTEYPAVIAAPAGQVDADPSGHALLASYDHSDRSWSWSGEYIELSPGFRADTGLINQVGVRAGEVNLQRRIRSNGRSWFSNIWIGGGVDMTREFHDEWDEWGADLNFTYEGPRQTYFSINLAPNHEYYAGATYDNFRQNVGASMQVTRDLWIGTSYSRGEAIDFTNERKADFVTIEPEMQFRIGRRMSGHLAYAYQEFETKQGQRIFAVDLPQAKLLYHFDSRTFVRAILQYETVRRNPASYDFEVDRREEGLLTQLLASYRVNAQTVFMVGYSEAGAGELRGDGLTLVTQGRTYFAKIGYAWLF